MKNINKVIEKFSAKDVSFAFTEIYKSGGKVYKTIFFEGYEVYFSNYDLETCERLHIKDSLQFKFIKSGKYATVVISVKMLNQTSLVNYITYSVEEYFNKIDKITTTSK